MLKTSGSTAKLNDPPLLQKKWSTEVKSGDVTLPFSGSDSTIPRSYGTKTNLTETNPQSLHCSSARKAVCAVNQQLVTDGYP